MFCPTTYKAGYVWWANDFPGFTTWSMAPGPNPQDSSNYHVQFPFPVDKLTHPGSSVHLVDHSGVSVTSVTYNAWTYDNLALRLAPHMGGSNYLFLDGHVEHMEQCYETERMWRCMD